ncbi:hypothetical protein [Brevibacterium aurantiacum]|uniref:hypothetical protein n=1 Tax=Brevibacterium aurantiacum TaxID=273384 RepID=UPI000F64CFAA|nr:hypothetical protein [Brevibacterium aurantiacum]
MNPVTIIGLSVTLVASILSAVGASNLYATSESAREAVRRASDPSLRSSDRHLEGLRVRAKWRDALVLGGVVFGVIGAVVAIIAELTSQ